MRSLALAVLLTTASCATLVGGGAGAGIGYLAGSPGKGALIGGAIGLHFDLEAVHELRELFKWLVFWA